MKHIFKPSFIITALLWVFGHGLFAQDTIPDNVEFVYMESVVKEFAQHVEQLETLPESNDAIVKEFLNQYNDKVIIIEASDAESYAMNPIGIYKRGLDITQLALDSIVSQKRKNMEVVQPQPKSKWNPKNWIWVIAVILTITMLFFIKNRKRNKVTTIVPPSNNNSSNQSGNNDIVVRRKTTSVLKKQSLEDVIDNENYMKIDCADFCNDSAVRRMYIKNTCIKEIYNMYAEDLRNPSNPKEDGCMVLGRWVYDQQADEYYVSLEHTVFPGDDAVFSEYELSFGAKIKINIMTKLRKLRQETQLQYDLTCWVHSHPGIGVFFSNTDYSLHLLHKHPTHPKFLTAIVVDILTPQQELGIFTFKRDMTINSKAELKKTYSLEEWYKWAVESSRNTFKPDDHFNTLAEAKSHIEGCHDIQLSNGAIIDMGMLTTEHHEEFVGKAYGFVRSEYGNKGYVVTKVSSSETDPEHELVGSFIMVSHCSIPSVRKALSEQLDKIGFVLVYSTTDGLLTSIPVVNDDLCTDPIFYGEQKLEDLKIWTRRRR